MTKQVGLPEEVINRFDKKYGVGKDDDLITTTRYSLLNDLAQAQEEVVDTIKKNLEYELEWMKRTQYEGDVFQEGGINGMKMAINVVNGKGRIHEVKALQKEQE